MSEQTDYKNGDTVRVVLEGMVVDLYGVYGDDANLPVFDIEADPSQRRGLFIDTSNEAVKSVEVLAAPLKVGDKVEGAQYDLLPIGTVIEGPWGPLWKVNSVSWSTPAGYNYLSVGINAPRTIKYLPS